MRIVILGTRGMPARYGGFETFAEQLSVRLVARGHDVTVFGRCKFGAVVPLEDYRGVHRVLAPTIMQKYLETPLHALTSFYLVRKGQFDAALICNAANSPMAWLLNVRRVPYAVNVDGIERKRRKWNRLGRLWYRLGEWCSVQLAQVVVADAQVISDYYKETYACPTTVIAYGAEVTPRPAGVVLKQFGLSPDNYLLYVSRLEPENNALGVVAAYERLAPEMPLVIVGDAPYASSYIAELKRLAGPNVVFTGFQFDEAYQELRSNCRAYIQATEVGGTHPALVEAMAYGNCVMANDTPEHREVLGDCGLFYSFNDFDQLSERMHEVLTDRQLVQRLGRMAQHRAARYYNWDHITDQYEELFQVLSGN